MSTEVTLAIRHGVRWLLAAILGGCTTVGVGQPPQETVVSTENFVEHKIDLGNDTSSAGGIATFTLHINEGETGFTFFGEADHLLMIERLTDPSGKTASKWQTWWYGNQDLTDAFWPYYNEVSLTWPMVEENSPLEAGDWTVQVASVDANWAYLGGVPIHASARIRTDENPDEGHVRIALVWAKDVENEPGVSEAVDQAIDHWREIWAPAGLTLEVREVSSNLDPSLDPPWETTSGVAEAATLADDGEIVVLMGDLLHDNPTWYGVSGGIPGPLEITGHSATSVSWLAHAGTDAKFNHDEILLFGETLAHEVGHYLGLQHPVQSDYSRWDTLADTPQCQNANTCESDLGDNIMFPYSICDNNGCVDALYLTDEQIGQLDVAGGAR